MPPRPRGCRQARGFYSQLIVGSSFNRTGFPDGRWNADPSIDIRDSSAPSAWTLKSFLRRPLYLHG